MTEARRQASYLQHGDPDASADALTVRPVDPQNAGIVADLS